MIVALFNFSASFSFTFYNHKIEIKFFKFNLTLYCSLDIYKIKETYLYLIVVNCHHEFFLVQFLLRGGMLLKTLFEPADRLLVSLPPEMLET